MTATTTTTTTIISSMSQSQTAADFVFYTIPCMSSTSHTTPPPTVFDLVAEAGVDVIVHPWVQLQCSFLSILVLLAALRPAQPGTSSHSEDL